MTIIHLSYILLTIILLYAFIRMLYLTISTFVIGRYKRLKLAHEMLQDEYTLREFEDITEAMDTIEIACDYCHDLKFTPKKVKRVEKKLLILAIIALFSLVGADHLENKLLSDREEIQTNLD